MFDCENVATPATLTPGPSWFNTFDPAAHNQPPPFLEQARDLAHGLARPYLLWDDEVLIVVNPHQHIATGLTGADVAMPPPPR